MIAPTRTLPRIGCAGWAIPAAWRARFPDAGTALQRYARQFDVVEVNSSFYRPHRPDTYARWAASVPARFRFCIKMPREISHERALRGVARPLDRFLDEVQALGNRLGGLLLQLPPSGRFDARVARAFFARLRQRQAAPVALEARHPDWFEPSAQSLLLDHDISCVAADPPRVGPDALPTASKRWRYFRWHGSPRIYYSRYADDDLQRLAAQLRHAPTRHWCIFDNTAAGHALGDALRLKALLASGGNASETPARSRRPR